MRRVNTALHIICAFALASGFSWPSPACADGPLDLPPATGIAPGDILIHDFFNDWIKFDPATDQLFSLRWDDRSVGPFALDLDGSIVSVDHSSSGYSLERLHPITGIVTSFGPSLPRISDVEILPDGDLLLAKSASSFTISGDVWTGGFDGALLRYSRQQGAMTRVPKPQQFSPYNIALSPTGETYILEHFRGLQQVDLTTGSLTDVAGAESERFWASTKVLPDGDFVYGRHEGIYRLDPDTGVKSLLNDDLRTFLVRLAADELGNVWAASHDGLYFIDGATGESTLRLPRAPFFSPQSMLVVPSDWTPPPVPEPSSLALSLLSLVAILMPRVGNKGGMVGDRS